MQTFKNTYASLNLPSTYYFTFPSIIYTHIQIPVIKPLLSYNRRRKKPPKLVSGGKTKKKQKPLFHILIDMQNTAIVMLTDNLHKYLKI